MTAKQFFRVGPAKTALQEDALWRRNLWRDGDKLGAELRTSRRNFIKGFGTTALVAAVDEYVMMRRTHAMFLHGGGAIPQAVSAITNQRTGKTYQYLPQAIYDPGPTNPVQSGDTILVPAGTHAPAYPATPYSDYRQLDSHYFGYSGNPSSGYGYMYIGPGYGPNPVTGISIVGVGSANNGRAAFSRPYAHLVADYKPGDTIMYLDNVSMFPPGVSPTNYLFAYVWGDGRDITLGVFYLSPITITGIDFNANTFTTINPYGGVTIPAGSAPGQMIIGDVPNRQCMLLVAGSTPCTFTNIELFGAASIQNGNANPIRQYGYAPGQTPVGSLVLNNCYFHDCQEGVGGSQAIIGDGIFAHVFQTEFFRNGWHFNQGLVHNAYFGGQDEMIFDGSYTHQTHGVHLFKTRTATNFFTYSRFSGERTDANTDGLESCNIDVPDGGLTYVIGCQFQRSLNASNSPFNYAAEFQRGEPFGSGVGNNEGPGSALHANQEIYFINNTIIGSANGTGNGYSTNYAAISLGAISPQNPEIPFLSASAAGSLPARTYWSVTSLVDGAGNESASSVLLAGYGTGGMMSYLPIPANNVLNVSSPAARTGTVGWNSYAAPADPRPYCPSFPGVPAPVGINYWFWDAAGTLPIFSQGAGGSYPTARQLLVSFTYQFPIGESVNLGCILYRHFNDYGAYGQTDGSGITPIVNPPYQPQAFFGLDANNLLTVKSPPSVPGATGWNVYITDETVIGYDSTTGMSKQNLSGPIAIGTDWTQPSNGDVLCSAQVQMTFYKQNASPLAFGTPWTEPTGGLANHNRTGKLVWRRRVGDNNAGLDEWWALAPSPLTNYVIEIQGLQFENISYNASCIAIKGASNTTWPFASTLPAAMQPVQYSTAPSLTFTEANAVIVAMFRAGAVAGTAGPGFTQILATPSINTEYKIATAGTYPITQTNGFGFDWVAADIIPIGAGGGVDGIATLNGSPAGWTAQLTISTTQPNDILILQVTSSYTNIIGDVDPVGPYQHTNIPPCTPIGIVDNNLLANFYTVPTGGIVRWSSSPAPVGVPLTIGAHNINFNTYSGSGSTFLAPLWASVINDPNQANYDYRLKAGSSPIGAGSVAGSNPHPTNFVGATLSAKYELKLFGSPTPGTPIPAKTARTDQATPDVGGLQYGV